VICGAEVVVLHCCGQAAVLHRHRVPAAAYLDAAPGQGAPRASCCETSI